SRRYRSGIACGGGHGRISSLVLLESFTTIPITLTSGLLILWTSSNDIPGHILSGSIRTSRARFLDASRTLHLSSILPKDETTNRDEKSANCTSSAESMNGLWLSTQSP